MSASPLLRVLFVEDSVEDCELAQRALHNHGLEHIVRRVSDAEDLRRSLAEFAPHLVISDFTLPGFGGLEALDIVRAESGMIPFIFLSGTIGEERAIEALRHGADDYVLKDQPKRLGPAVERAVRAAQERGARLAAEQRVRAIIETTGEWLWEIDAAWRFSYSNAAVATLLGWTPEELLGRDGLSLLHPEHTDAARMQLAAAAADGTGWRDLQFCLLHRDGHEVWVESNGVAIHGAGGAVVGWCGADRDVTERLQQERRLRRLSRIESVMSAVNAMLVRERDRERLLHEACRIAVELGGLRVAWIATRMVADGPLVLLAQHGAPEAYVAPFLEAINSGHGPETTTTRALRTGRPQVESHVHFDPAYGVDEAQFRERGVRAAMSLPLARDGDWLGVLVLYAAEPEYFGLEEAALFERMADDIAYGMAFIERDERLAYLAYHDPLTGLPNRTALLEAIEANGDRSACLCVFDIAGLRLINEARGRHTGDAVLREVGRRLRERLGRRGLVAHLAGDQFGLMLHRDPDSASADGVLHELLGGEAGLTLEVEGQPLGVVLRGGYVFGPRNGMDADSLLGAAEAALSGAKASGRALEVYREELAERARARRELELRLRQAVERREFVVFYQPKLSIDGQRLMGAEALVRWQDPERGLIPPFQFIPVLEETGLIGAVGDQVLAQALADLARWRADGLAVPSVAVNMAAPQLRDPDLVRKVEQALAAAGLPGTALELELTESLVMEEPQRAIETLQALRGLGVDVSIDDFGTGYSSLAYLTRLPVAALKIDRAFVNTVNEDPQTTALVTMMVGLAQAMRIRTVAEGVERTEQLKLLRLLRCDEAQGFLFSKPLPAPEFERWTTTLH